MSRRERRALGAVLVATLALLSWPATAEPSLAERNRLALLDTLPEGALMEVSIVGTSGERSEVWSAEAYATFRGATAARLGRDYAAAGEGLPSGLGARQEYGDLFSDLWGTTRVNIESPAKCLPATIRLDATWWLYEGPCYVVEHDNACFPTPWGGVCSFTFYGMLFTGHAFEHGDAWLAGGGELILFPAPFGALASYTGVIFADEVEA